MGPTGSTMNTKMFVRAAPVTRELACEGQKMLLRCPESTVMRLTEATFGRLNSETCSPEAADPPVERVTNCSQPDALETLATLCNGKNRCEVYAFTSLLGDPCRGVSKYLMAAYTCGGTRGRRCRQITNN